MTLDDFDIPKEHLNIDHIRSAIKQRQPTVMPNTASHLIYVDLQGPWFFINGNKTLRFKTRGDNAQDLFNALQQYNIDYWESDFEQVISNMASQLYAQMVAKNRYDVYLKNDD